MEDANTKVLLHFDGTDGSTTFTDSAPPNRTWTAYGNAQIDTAEKKFGTGSGLFGGTGNWIDTPDSEDFNVGSGDFTIDCWIKLAVTGIVQSIFGQFYNSPPNASILFYVDSGNKLCCSISDGSNYKSIVSTITIDTNWRHVAVIRYANTAKLYIDGTNSGSVDMTGVSVNNPTTKVAIGRRGEATTYYFNGWIDEFRFVKGVAKWTTNFTPPTAPYSFGWAGKIFGVQPAKIFGVVPKRVCGI